ncbi:MAG: SEL1-like repeat protein [Alloprevotella sp.]|nr:SEL1-like repeat protein [Alloprevotella sp.]
MRTSKRKRIAPWLFLLLATLQMQAQETAHWVVQGDSLYEREQYGKAAHFYKKAAEAGLAEGQCKLGFAYYVGEGVARNVATAVTWFKRAARQNYPKAEYNLAFCYMHGRGVPQDYERGIELLKTAAEGGCSQAQRTLADCYEKGVFVVQDKREAQIWRQRADAADGAAMAGSNEEGQECVPAPGTAPAPAVSATGTSITGTSVPYTPATEASEKVLAQEEEEYMEEAYPDAPRSPAELSAFSPTAAPRLSILYPENGAPFHTKEVKLKYHLQADGMERETQVIVMVDGERQPATRAVRAADVVDVELPERDCTVTVYAQNRNGYSEPASIRLHREKVSTEEARIFAVVIGVSKYGTQELPNLRYSAKDAEDFARAVAEKQGHPFAEIFVKPLVDEDASRREIHEALKWLKQEVTPTDLCLFFFAGHGFRDEKDRFYFIPYGGGTDNLYDCFSSQEFCQAAEDIDGKFIVFLDACYSGALGERSAGGADFADQLRRVRNGMLLYASSAGDTKSREDENWKNGAFTRALVEAFGGAARSDDAEGLSTNQLANYLAKRVREITKGAQRPVFKNPNGLDDFNLFNYE